MERNVGRAVAELRLTEFALFLPTTLVTVVPETTNHDADQHPQEGSDKQLPHFASIRAVVGEITG